MPKIPQIAFRGIGNNARHRQDLEHLQDIPDEATVVIFIFIILAQDPITTSSDLDLRSLPCPLARLTDNSNRGSDFHFRVQCSFIYVGVRYRDHPSNISSLPAKVFKMVTSYRRVRTPYPLIFDLDRTPGFEGMFWDTVGNK